MKTGKHKLLLWKGEEADGSVATKTPCKTPALSEMYRRNKVLFFDFENE